MAGGPQSGEIDPVKLRTYREIQHSLRSISYDRAMARDRLVPWFEGAVSHLAQTVPFILPRMALTFVAPNHPDRLYGSCHAKAALALAHGHKQGLASPDDKIKIFGSELQETAFHTIITTKDGVVRYDSLSDIPGCRYDAEHDRYISPDWDEAVSVKHELTFADFLKDYVGKIKLPPTAPSSDPS